MSIIFCTTRSHHHLPSTRSSMLSPTCSSTYSCHRKQLVICHFYHADFRRCEILNKHLDNLAPKHFKTKYGLPLLLMMLLMLITMISVSMKPHCLPARCGLNDLTYAHWQVHQGECGERALPLRQAQDSSAPHARLLHRRHRQGPCRRVRGLWFVSTPLVISCTSLNWFDACAGNSDTFTTQQLEVRIARSGVIALAGQGESIAKKTVFGFAPAAADSDDE